MIFLYSIVIQTYFYRFSINLKRSIWEAGPIYIYPLLNSLMTLILLESKRITGIRNLYLERIPGNILRCNSSNEKGYKPGPPP